MMTFDDLGNEAENHIAVFFPRRVESVQCPHCGATHKGVIQLRYGKYARYIDLGNGNVAPLRKCCSNNEDA